MNLHCLPEPILFAVLQHCNNCQDLARCSCASATLAVACDDSRLWALLLDYTLDCDPSQENPKTAMRLAQQEQSQHRASTILSGICAGTLDRRTEALVALINCEAIASHVAQRLVHGAVRERHFAPLYAHMAMEASHTTEGRVGCMWGGGQGPSFRHLLLNETQKAFEDALATIPSNATASSKTASPGGAPCTGATSACSPDAVGAAKFVGVLFSRGMMKEAIFHSCVAQLFGLISELDEISFEQPSAAQLIQANWFGASILHGITTGGSILHGITTGGSMLHGITTGASMLHGIITDSGCVELAQKGVCGV